VDLLVDFTYRRSIRFCCDVIERIISIGDLYRDRRYSTMIFVVVIIAIRIHTHIYGIVHAAAHARISHAQRNLPSDCRARYVF
jgi:hypothetical protein